MPRHFAWHAWHNVISTFVSRGRRGVMSHPPSFCVAGVALMALGGAAWAGFSRAVTPRHFAWQAWHNVISTFVSRGRCGAMSHPPSFHVAGVAQCHIHLRFAWQAWHLWYWVACLGLLWSRVTPRHFAWQAWHLVTSTFVSRGRRGAYVTSTLVSQTISHTSLSHTICHIPSLSHTICLNVLSHTIFHTIIFVNNSLMHIFVTHRPPASRLTHIFIFHTHFVTYHLSHTILSHTIFHTHHLSHTPLCHLPSLTHHLSHHFVTHTIFHTPLCYTPSFTHHLLHTIFHTTLSHTMFHTPSQTIFHTPSFTHHLSHTTLSHTIFNTPSFTHHFVTHTHTPSFTTPSFTHNFVTHHLFPHHL